MTSGAVSLKDTGYSGASSNGAPVIKLKENGEHRRDAGDVDNEKKGLLHPGALTVVVSWYVVSFVVLIINKHVLSTLGGDAVILSCIQMVVLTILAYVQMHYPCGLFKPAQREGSKPPNFFRNNMIVGCIRFMTVFMGILALRNTTISFTETVKSSAPIFTVGISRLMLGELNGPYVMCSLLPIMFGLAMCSTYELSFNIPGFASALANNFFECLQFVYSKMLIGGDGNSRYTPAEFQFYTGLSSVVVQLPCCLLLIDMQHVWSNTSLYVFLLMVIDGVLYHVQTLLAFMLMSYISPVTHSVVNVVKRAFMIWGSVLVFNNHITFLSGLGTCVVFLGVLCYNKARDIEHTSRKVSTVPDLLEMKHSEPVRHV